MGEDKFQDANVRLMIKLTFPPHVSASDLEVMTSNGGPGTSFYAEGLSGGMAVRYDPGRGRAIEIYLFRPRDCYLKGRSSQECRDGLSAPNEPILSLEEYRSKGKDPQLIRRIINHHRWLDPSQGVTLISSTQRIQALLCLLHRTNMPTRESERFSQ